eukprot:m.45887 g.45887  ORF g.45887 m.45887 type:complete len:561 (+) comp10307_c0_seq1:331-2013(+)
MLRAAADDKWLGESEASKSDQFVLLRTTVIGVNSLSDGTIDNVTLVQRTVKDGVDEWSYLLSESIQDWYSPIDSDKFSKEVISILKPKAVIEATEFGDVLMNAGVVAGQGIERPTELSTPGSDDTCGQATTLTFYTQLLEKAPENPTPVPAGGDSGVPFDNHHCCCPSSVSLPGTKNCTFEGVWSYRRAHVGIGGSTAMTVANPGDVSQQNWGGGNDLSNAYMFLPLKDAYASAQSKSWMGGLNMTALRMLEQRAYGWFHAYNDTAPAKYQNRIVLNYTVSGTTTGLAKMPYLRDTRRSVGLNGFRMVQASETANGSSFGYRFPDTVALGNYNSDDHQLSICSKPDYMTHNVKDTVPFYIPFRALTHMSVPNMLVAGKTMATTFFANSATRLHPCEWTTGVAAGAAAILMVANDWTTQEVYEHVEELQMLLNSSKIAQPLEWHGGKPPNPPPQRKGYVCGFSAKRCLGVPLLPIFNSSTCDGRCSPLNKDEWLANEDYWTSPDSQGLIAAKSDTVLKKELVDSENLPPSEILGVKAGTKCKLTVKDGFREYFLCTPQMQI